MQVRENHLYWWLFQIFQWPLSETYFLLLQLLTSISIILKCLWSLLNALIKSIFEIKWLGIDWTCLEKIFSSFRFFTMTYFPLMFYIWFHHAKIKCYSFKLQHHHIHVCEHYKWYFSSQPVIKSIDKIITINIS